MEADPRIAAIIVSHNTKALLLRSVASALESAAALDIPLELLVVDNASTDGSAPALRENCPRARLIENSTNVGFGAACNQAIKITTARFILLLNSDARISADALRSLLDCMTWVHHCGAAGCKLVDERGNPAVSARRFLTPFNQALEILGLPNALPVAAWRRTHTLRLDANLRDCSPDWIDGACLMLNRAALTETGPFDERFFMYSEDEDLCVRLRGAGWQVCYCASGAVVHVGGASSAQQRAEMLVHFYLSQMLLLAKHRGRRSALLFASLMRLALALKRLLRWVGLSSVSADELNDRTTALSRARRLSLDSPADRSQ